ncbi:MAG: hypothetical protein LC808_05615 [Actinobacteria bacterium]|nr:hypothetical protein [Actinomycetota bacterium]
MNEQRFTKRAGVAGVLLALAVVVSAGCSSSGSSKATSTTLGAAVTHSYAGAAEGTAAFVGVVVDGSRALAYVCDGVPADPEGTAPTIQAWFNGPSNGGSVDVTQADNRLELQLTDSTMTGTLTLADGRQIPVTGTVTTGDAGLYRAEASGDGSKAVAGWILAADGQQRGGVGGEGSFAKLSGARTLTLSQPTISLQGLATARIAKVGITPIPIP